MFPAHRILAKVYGNLAIGYHRTKNINNTKAIGETGFKIGGKKVLYLPGIYMTYSFDDQQDERMKGLYGPFVVKNKVKLTGFLILDMDVAKVAYPNKYTIQEQLPRFGIIVPDEIIEQKTKEYTSELARHLVIKNLINKNVRGLVFTGAQDGKVLVSYYPEDVVPMSYARVIDLTKTLDKVKWNKYTNPPIKIPTKPIDLMTFLETVRRYFVNKGFVYHPVIIEGENDRIFMSKGNSCFWLVNLQHDWRCIFGLKRDGSVFEKKPDYWQSIQGKFEHVLVKNYMQKTPQEMFATLSEIEKTADSMEKIAKDRYDANKIFAAKLFNSLSSSKNITLQKARGLCSKTIIDSNDGFRLAFINYKDGPAGDMYIQLWGKSEIHLGWNGSTVSEAIDSSTNSLGLFAWMRNEFDKIEFPKSLSPQYIKLIKSKV